MLIINDLTTGGGGVISGQGTGSELALKLPFFSSFALSGYFSLFYKNVISFNSTIFPRMQHLFTAPMRGSEQLIFSD